ncbi:MAG TPA: HAMP domain-containing sensor histidine kinase [Solirubrobacteraceae bacterium]
MSRAPLMHGLRGRLLGTVAVAFALFLAAVTIAFNLVLDARLNSDATSVAQARAAAIRSSISVRAGRLRLPDSPDEHSPDAQLWVFEGSTPLEEPRGATPAERTTALALVGPAPAQRDVAVSRERLRALPLIQSGRRLGTVVSAVSLRPYDETRKIALFGSLALAVALFLAAGVAAAWLIANALKPVARMTRQAAEWSEHDLDRRFALGRPRDELTRLAATLDGLLDRLAASLRREQRLSAELSHELRTPLAAIAADAQYALRRGELTGEARESAESILDATRRMARTIDTLMAAARAELDPGRACSDATAAVRASIAAAGSVDPAAVPIAITASAAGALVAAEPALVERILAPVIENAQRHAASSVEVAIERNEDKVVFSVADDGAGLGEEDAERVFEPGRRSAGVDGAALSGSAGLGLSLARRLARSAGGDVSADPAAGRGLFTITLPAAQGSGGQM